MAFDEKLVKARSVMLLKNLKKGDELHFWLCPAYKERKTGAEHPPVLIVEKDSSRLAPKVKEVKKALTDKGKVFEGVVERDDKNRVVFRGEGKLPAKRAKDSLKALKDDDVFKKVKGALAAPRVMGPDGEVTDEAERDAEGSAEPEQELDSGGHEPPDKPDWVSKAGDARLVFTEARDVLGKDSEGFAKVKQLQTEALAARKKDVERAIELLDEMVAVARGLIAAAFEAKEPEPEVSQDDWLEAKAAVQEVYAALRKVTGEGDPDFDAIEALRVASVTRKKKGDLAGSVELLRQVVADGEALRGQLDALDPGLTTFDLAEESAELAALAEDLKKAKRRHAWFWFCPEGETGDPVLLVDRKEAKMQMRGKAARKEARIKKSSSGWIENDDGVLVFWCEGALPLAKVEKAFKKQLAKLDALSAVAPLLRKAIFRDAGSADERPVDTDEEVEGGDTAPRPFSFVALQKARLEWDAARKAVRADIEAVKKSLSSSFPEEADTVGRLDVVLQTFDEALLDALDDALNADGEERIAHQNRATKLVGVYRGELASNRLVPHLDANPFVKTKLGSTLSTALGKVAAALA